MSAIDGMDAVQIGAFRHLKRPNPQIKIFAILKLDIVAQIIVFKYVTSQYHAGAGPYEVRESGGGPVPDSACAGFAGNGCDMFLQLSFPGRGAGAFRSGLWRLRRECIYNRRAAAGHPVALRRCPAGFCGLMTRCGLEYSCRFDHNLACADEAIQNPSNTERCRSDDHGGCI